MLKRWGLILVMLSVVFSGCLRKNYGLEPKPKGQIILRLADIFTTDYPSTAAGARFAQLVEKRTRGRIKVRLYENGELGDELSVIEQTQFGGIDLARVNSALLLEYLHNYQTLLMPSLYRDEGHLQGILNGKIGAEFGNELLKEKLVLLCWYETGDYGFYNTRKKLETVDGFSGLKFGVLKAQTLQDRISGLGGTPVPLETGEVFGQLQTRAIDGAQNNLVLYYLLHHYLIAKYYTIDEGCYFPDVLLGSRVSLMQLTKTNQKLIAAAARDSVRFQKKAWQKSYLEATTQLKLAGVEMTGLDVRQRQKMLRITEQVYQKLKTEERFLIKKVRAIR
jgi:TRAP-type C4-dicarboxylate transport system substrate-binding protein